MTTAVERLAVRRLAALKRPPVDLSDLFEDALDQGARPTCVAVVLADLHGRSARPQYRAAAETLWWDLDQRGLTSAAGVLVGHAGEALTRTGHCEDAVWPYDPELGHGSQPPPPAAGLPPWDRADLAVIALAHDGVEADLEAALAAGRPTMLVIEVTEEFYDADKATGLIAAPDIRAPSGGFHAVLAVGAWTEPGVGRVLLLRNSWGPDWGALGYGLLPVEYLIAHAAPDGWQLA